MSEPRTSQPNDDLDDMKTAPLSQIDPRLLSKPMPEDAEDDDDALRTAPLSQIDPRLLSQPTPEDADEDDDEDEDDDALRTAPVSQIDPRLLSKPTPEDADEDDALLTPPKSAFDSAKFGSDAFDMPIIAPSKPLSNPVAADVVPKEARTLAQPIPENVSPPTEITPEELKRAGLTEASLSQPATEPSPWLARARRQLTTQFRPNFDVHWMNVVYSPDIDKLLAEMALDDDDEEVADQAARSIGRIRSEAAVLTIADKQRAGDLRALRALAIIRDEVASLPAGVSRQARLYAWLANTLRRLGEHSPRSMWRFILAALGAAIAFGAYTWGNLPGFSIFEPDRWSMGVSVGLTMGVLMGFRALLAGELPARLRGFFPWWGVLGWALIAGILVVGFTWASFTWLFLKYPVEEWTPILAAGLGGALGMGLASLFRLPGWLSALVDGVSMWIPLYFAWENNWNTGEAGVIYFRQFEGVYNELIPMVAIMVIGAWAPAIWRDLNWLRTRALRLVRRGK